MDPEACLRATPAQPHSWEWSTWQIKQEKNQQKMQVINFFAVWLLMHWLFDEVLALFSGQENSGSYSQSADERHLLATVP